MEEELKPTSALYSTSVPIRVPLSLRQNSREVEMIEVFLQPFCIKTCFLIQTICLTAAL